MVRAYDILMHAYSWVVLSFLKGSWGKRNGASVEMKLQICHLRLLPRGFKWFSAKECPTGTCIQKVLDPAGFQCFSVDSFLIATYCRLASRL